MPVDTKSKLTISDVIKKGAIVLESSGLENPFFEAEYLMGYLLNKTRTELYLGMGETLSLPQMAKFESWISRRCNREPAAYITNSRNFMGYEYNIDCNVLVPRPETEILVSKVIEWVRNQSIDRARILEIGTGSGCVAIEIARAFPKFEVVAVDILDTALSIAHKNSKQFGVPVKFMKSDLYQRLYPDFEGEFDMIVSNPPYISSAVLETLEPELKFEPQEALNGGPDGLSIIKQIIDHSSVFLKKKGAIFLEIGFDQEEAVRKMLSDHGYPYISFEKDWNGHSRIAIGAFNGSI